MAIYRKWTFFFLSCVCAVTKSMCVWFGRSLLLYYGKGSDGVSLEKGVWKEILDINDVGLLVEARPSSVSNIRTKWTKHFFPLKWDQQELSCAARYFEKYMRTYVHIYTAFWLWDFRCWIAWLYYQNLGVVVVVVDVQRPCVLNMCIHLFLLRVSLAHRVQSPPGCNSHLTDSHSPGWDNGLYCTWADTAVSPAAQRVTYACTFEMCVCCIPVNTYSTWLQLICTYVHTYIHTYTDARLCCVVWGSVGSIMHPILSKQLS